MGESSVVAAKQEPMSVPAKQEPDSDGNNMLAAVKQEQLIVVGDSSPAAPYPMSNNKKKKIPQKNSKNATGEKRTRCSAEKKQQQTTSTKKQGGRRRRSHSTSPPSYIVEIKQADEHGIFSNGRLATLKYLDFSLPKKSEMCLVEDKKEELGERMDEEVDDESIYLEHMQKLANMSSVGM